MIRSRLVRAALPPDPDAAAPLLAGIPRFQKLTGLHVDLAPRASAPGLDLVHLPRLPRSPRFHPLDLAVPPYELDRFPDLAPWRAGGRLLALPCAGGAFAIPLRAPNPHGADLLLRCFCTPRPLPGKLAPHHGEHEHEAPL